MAIGVQPESGGVPTISELVEQRRRFLGLSYRELSERAGRAGWHVKYQTIQALAVEAPRQWPKRPETIKGLAEALDVPEHMVVLAFARSFGLDVQAERSRLASLLPSGAATLSPAVQDSIALLVRSLIDAIEESRHERTAPITRAGGSPAHDPEPPTSDLDAAAESVLGSLSPEAAEAARQAERMMRQGAKRSKGLPQ